MIKELSDRFIRKRWSKTRIAMDAMKHGEILELPMSEYFNAKSSADRMNHAHWETRNWTVSRKRGKLTVTHVIIETFTQPVNTMSNRTTSSLSVSCSSDERRNIDLLAAELGVPINRAVHKAVRQSLRAIGIDPDAVRPATKGNQAP